MRIMPADARQSSADRQGPGLVIASQISALARGQAIVRLAGERPWASITFSGMRYSFEIERSADAEVSALQELVQFLPDHEFMIPGYFVADTVIRDQSRSRILVDILAIIDPVDARRIS